MPVLYSLWKSSSSPYLDFKEILIRIQIRLITLEQLFRHIYFSLQRLFLLPQGRAPPLYIPV